MSTKPPSAENSSDDSRQNVKGTDVILAVNPRAGSGAGAHVIARLVAALEACQLRVHQLSDLDLIKQRVPELRDEQRLRCVIAAGGDGTIRLLAETLGTDLHFGIYPLGTENLLAKFLRIPRRPREFADLISRGTSQRIDAGRANGQLFLIMVGCGFDADVVHRLHASRQGNISHSAYFWPLIQAWRTYPFEPLNLRVDGQAWQVLARWAFVFNVPRYAMNLPIVPDAQATDGQLDICVFARGHLWHGLKYIAGMMMRRHRGWSDVHHRTARTIEVSAATPIPYQIDGDPGGTLPVLIETLPRYLSVITPSAVK